METITLGDAELDTISGGNEPTASGHPISVFNPVGIDPSEVPSS